MERLSGVACGLASSQIPVDGLDLEASALCDNRSAFLRLARQLSHAVTRHLYCHLIGNGILHASAFFLPFMQYPIGSGKFLLSTYSRVAHALPSSPSSVRSANSPLPSFTRLLIKLSYFFIIPSGQVNRLYLHYPFGSGNSPYLHYPIHSGAPSFGSISLSIREK